MSTPRSGSHWSFNKWIETDTENFFFLFTSNCQAMWLISLNASSFFFCLFAPLWNASLFRTWEDSDRCKRKWKVKGQVWSLYPSFSCFCILNNNNNLEKRKEKKHDDRMKRTVYRENYLQRLALLWKKNKNLFLYYTLLGTCNVMGKQNLKKRSGTDAFSSMA